MIPAGAGGPGRDDAARASEAVDRIARKIAVQLDLEELARSVVVEVQEALDAEAAAVLLVDGAELRFVAATGPKSAALRGLRIPLTQGVAGQVARTGRSALVADGSKDPRVARQVDEGSGFRTRTLVASPLVVQGRTIGVVEAVNRRQRVDGFGPGDLLFLDRLAPHVAAAVTNASFAAELRRSRDQLARHAEELERRVSDRTRALVTATQEWTLTFDSIPEPLAIYEDGIVRRTNLAYARASGIDVRRLPGLPCHVARFGRDEPCEGCPLAASPATDHVEAEVRGGGGTWQLRAFRLNDPARPQAWVTSYRDVSEERRLKAKLSEAERLSAVGRLAAGAAHEINNPMAFVSAALRSLRDHVRDLTAVSSLGTLAAELAVAGRDDQAVRALRSVAEKAKEVDVQGVAQDALMVLEEAEVGARRVTAIVQALKVLGREELGRDEDFEVSVVLERAVERARKAGPFPRVEWVRREPVRVRGRPLQFDQALYEIARNAGQATDPRKGVIRLSCRSEGGRAVVEVADDGAGIAPETRAKIFEPFFTTRGIGGGVGLGLTIAYGVVRRHGGDIEVLSDPGRGATIRIVLHSTDARPPSEDGWNDP